MGALDLALLALILLAVFLALRSLYKVKKSGRGCSGACSSCTANCPGRKNEQDPS